MINVTRVLITAQMVPNLLLSHGTDIFPYNRSHDNQLNVQVDSDPMGMEIWHACLFTQTKDDTFHLVM